MLPSRKECEGLSGCSIYDILTSVRNVPFIE